MTRPRHAGLEPASNAGPGTDLNADGQYLARRWTPAQGRGDGGMEFAVEAQKLLGISLEGSVG